MEMEQVHFFLLRGWFSVLYFGSARKPHLMFAEPGLNLRKTIQSDGLAGKPLGGRQWRPSSIQ